MVDVVIVISYFLVLIMYQAIPITAANPAPNNNNLKPVSAHPCTGKQKH